MAASFSSLLGDAALGLTTGDHLAPPPRLPAHRQASVFPKLARGQLHEWHLDEKHPQRHRWPPPLTLLTALAMAAGDGNEEQGRVLWIGRRCWPTFQHLCLEKPALAGLLQRCTFLDPLSDAERFWAIAEALRCPGVRCVVADGGGMAVTVSRRLQLAAASGRALGLLARPGWELQEPSYAATRWRVKPRESVAGRPRWQVELHRCRGQQVEQDAPPRWIAEWSYQVLCGTGALHFSSDVGCGSAASQVVAKRDRLIGA